MMESTANGGENNAFSEQENPFQDGERIVEEVQIVDEEAAAEAARKEEIQQQMQKLEAEITTLRSALERKEKQHADLKRELGLTAWSQLRQGIGSQISYIQSTGIYNKTCKTLSSAGEATTHAFKTAGVATAKKMEELRDSDTFKSFESKVSSATSTIKGKMVRAKSEDMDEVIEGVDEVDPNLEKS